MKQMKFRNHAKLQAFRSATGLAALLLVVAPLHGEDIGQNHQGVTLHHDEQAKTVEVVVRGETFTTYHYGSKRHVPFLWPVNGEGGVGLTRNFPMGSDEPPSKDHPHHVSLYLTHGDVNGHDFWHVDRGRSGTIRTVALETGASEGSAWIRARNHWLPRNRESPLLESVQELRFHDGPPGARFFDFDITFTASQGDVTFGDTKEGFFALRLRPEMQGDKGGVLTNAHGARGEAAVYGKPSAWMDYSGPVKGHGTRGIALFDHPDNPIAAQWHVRDYGLAALNPFGRRSVARLADGSHTLKAGESLALRYRVLVHSGDVSEADVAGHYARYLADSSATAPVE